MPRAPRRRSNQLLAKYYDLIFTEHHAWAQPARAEVLGEILLNIESSCDLACGTGSTAMEMASLNLRVFALDLSPAMCALARRKARQARLRVTVIESDMRDFQLPALVDLVTCEFDALNHVPARSDLAKVANSVSRALRPGGFFYFDVNTHRAFEDSQPLARWAEQPGVALVMHGDYDPDACKASVDLEWFVRSGRYWRRVREHVDEVCWSAAEIRRALRKAGFDSIRSWDAASFVDSPPLERGHRTIYLARKSRAAE